MNLWRFQVEYNILISYFDIKDEYWDKQMDGISCQNSSEDQDYKQVDEVKDLLTRFKQLKVCWLVRNDIEHEKLSNSPLSTFIAVLHFTVTVSLWTIMCYVVDPLHTGYCKPKTFPL